ncbi:NAD-dependent epimerase/dehydratase family protein [Streptomyces sp. R302]|uniref:NAD-dependent epimerase/dehydratase family protein n=1 Tax=unclassified Streptomyces TaxID=2593676 RepID=UPI00145E95BA|nr:MULTISPECIES: NAD-dependent epimerase/dehydratase family protein [unclassified Streptomyces]NML55381.1 NAD-dependent epimerase/dehydratase family protein [Streptomyces sp. R301]NML80253.1 NAD-dependent epimerase/dehydratase family protein [Streptomyces sp. R302]
MRVLITGAAGFIGRHLHRRLLDAGHEVLGIDLTPTPLAHGRDALELFRRPAPPRSEFDLAIHCAAIVGGRASIDGSPLAVATNLGLDAWYMRWLTRARVPRAVYFSSSAAYPVALQQPGPLRRLTETDIDFERPGRPDATYGLAKLAGEQLCAYAEAEGTRLTVLRPFSGYGADQDPAYPFPAFIRRAKQQQDPFEIWGDGSSTRDWIHVDDVVDATLAAVAEGVQGPVNLGTGRATSFDELAALVTEEHGYRPEFKHLPAAPQGVHHRVADTARLRDFYEPRITLEEGIARALSA